MSLNYAPSEVSAATYADIFAKERAQAYSMVDAFEARMGYAIDRERLEEAGRVLSCPYKAAAPNWQHGRVLYAAVRNYLASLPYRDEGPAVVRTLDIGTAKGYSALCVRFAVEDAGVDAQSVSVDVLPPDARVRRNTPAEVDGLKTLAEILSPWPEASRIQFLNTTGVDFLKGNALRIHIAFVDGKHSGAVVKQEGLMLADVQQPGDLVIFDDVHIPDVGAAVDALAKVYDIERLQILPKRAYAIARRK
jgi:predicted O-methyltransferase YrrM